ncbi:MAG TPA: hypothetical protein VJM78_04740, partial [Rhizomicrobium sp.]|nr:hypothetical protein [Rhizomicrobium sp.]
AGLRLSGGALENRIAAVIADNDWGQSADEWWKASSQALMSSPASANDSKREGRGIQVESVSPVLTPGFPSGRSPKLAAFVARNGPPDHFVCFANRFSPPRIADAMLGRE